MLMPTREILQTARGGCYGVGAFNIYNLEGATAVVRAAEELKSPVMLQILPSALQLGGRPLIAMCCELANCARVPVAVHLDHCSIPEMHKFALEGGMSSVMADGAGMDFEDNVNFTGSIVTLAREKGAAVEGELGKLSGEEDGLSVDQREAKLTSPDEAVEFVERTKVDALAVCIGNVHGKYHNPPELDFRRLEIISKRISIPLVLHGTSGLPDHMITEAIRLGVCKFNVNTEVRSLYMKEMASCFNSPRKVELVDLMQRSIDAMMVPIRQKIKLFCSADKTALLQP